MDVLELFPHNPNSKATSMLVYEWCPANESWYYDAIPIFCRNKYKKDRMVALVDNSDVSCEIKKDLGCMWSKRYKKWIIHNIIYRENAQTFINLGLHILCEVVRMYDINIDTLAPIAKRLRSSDILRSNVILPEQNKKVENFHYRN